MIKMMSLVERGKWGVLLVAVVACGGVGTSLSESGPGGVRSESAGGTSAVSPADGEASASASAHEAGQAGAPASDDGGSAGDIAAGAAGSPSEAAAGQPASGGAESGGVPAGGQPNGGAAQGDQAAGGAEIGGQGGGSAGSAGAAGAPACVCSTGQCCDGCQLRPSSYLIGVQPRTSSCLNVPPPSLAGSAIYLEFWNVFCTGASATEQRWGAHVNETATKCPYQWTCASIDHTDTPTSAVCYPP